MELDRKKVPVVFEGGIDNKTPDYLTIPGKFRQLVNVIRRKVGQLKKRFGFTEVTRNQSSRSGQAGPSPDSESGLISGIYKMIEFQGVPTVFGYKQLWRYDVTTNEWVHPRFYNTDPGFDLIPCKTTATILDGKVDIVNHNAIIANEGAFSISPLRTWTCVANGYIHHFVAKTKYGKQYRWYIINESTGETIFMPQAAVTEPPSDTFKNSILGAATINGFICSLIVYTNTGPNFDIYKQTPGNDQGSEVCVVSTGSTLADTSVVGNPCSGYLIAYNATDGIAAVGALDGKVFLIRFNPNGAGTIINSTNFTPTGTGFTYVESVAIDSLGQIFVTCIRGTDKTTTAFSSNFSVKSGERAHGGLYTTSLRTVGTDDVSGSISVFEYADTGTDGNITAGTMDWDGIAASVPFLNMGAFINQRMKPVSNAVFYDGVSYLMVQEKEGPQINQATYLVASTNASENSFAVARVVSKVYEGSPYQNFILCSMEHTGTKFYSALGYTSIVSTISAAGAITGIGGMAQIQYDFSTANVPMVATPESLFIGSGILWEYDGRQIYENNFFSAPSVAASPVSGGTRTAGTYQIIVIFEYTNLFGVVHRSAPSFPISISLGATQQLQVVLNGWGLTNKPIGEVKLVVYSTEANGVVFYRYGERYINSSGSTIITEGLNPNTSAQLIYTTGGVTENSHPEGIRAITSFKGRLFMAHGVSGITYSYTRVKAPSEAYCWSFDNISVETLDGGAVAGFGALDEKLIFFQRSTFKYLTGEGPDDAGGNSDYRPLTPVPIKIGLKYADSIINIPTGIMFQSDKGVYVLDRSLNVGYLGADVEDFNALEITSAVIMDEHDEVRFTTRTGSTLVYNYFFNQWSVFTNYTAVGACVAGVDYWHIDSDSIPRKESTAFVDGSANIQMTIETGWFPLDTLQGYQRIYVIELLGELLSAHTIQVELAYDYNTNYTETVTFASTNVPSGGPMQFRIKPQIQKCEAFKLRIKDLSNSGAAFNLAGISVEVGVKKGLNKMRASQTV